MVLKDGFCGLPIVQLSVVLTALILELHWKLSHIASAVDNTTQDCFLLLHVTAPPLTMKR